MLEAPDGKSIAEGKAKRAFRGEGGICVSAGELVLSDDGGDDSDFGDFIEDGTQY